MSVSASSIDAIEDAIEGDATVSGQGQSEPDSGDTKRSASMQAVARGSTKRGEMNKTEGRWASVLDAHEEVLDWWYESYRVRYGDSGYHTPDFMVLRVDGSIEIHETKAHCTDAGRTRWKAAADTHWCFRWLMLVQKGKQKPWTCKYDTENKNGSPYI